MNGNKISKKYENFFDNILLGLTEKLNPFYKKIGMVPNTLTFLSLSLTLIGEYYFFKNKNLIGGIFYLIGYYFDCADGNFARTYNMVTVFGDWFDHISDILKLIILFCLIYHKLGLSKKFFIVIGILIVFSIGFSFQMGCQQKIYQKTSESPTLDCLIKLCPDKKLIHYTKYVGVGTFQLVVFTIIVFFDKIKKY